MSGFSDASMAVDEARRYSRMIGLSACESVYGTPGACSVDQLAHALLVRGVDDRPEQADRDRLDAELARALDRVHDRGLVERDERLALGVHALADLEREPARDVRQRVRDLLERVGLAALAHEQDVGEALGREERRARGLALDDRVRRARRAVRQHLGLREQLARPRARGARRPGRCPRAGPRRRGRAWSAPCRARAAPARR